MIGKWSVRFMISKLVILIIILARETSAGFYDCVKIDKNDNRIRIGFLSRYKSSKVSTLA